MTTVTKTEIALRNKLHLVCDEVGPIPDGLYDYASALSAAGVRVIEFKQFGSYQGTWWAEVAFPNREVYFVTGYYGSCSGCDAFQGEFGFSWLQDEPGYLHRLKDFGRTYLEECFTREQAIERASVNIDWDLDAEEMVAWLKSRPMPVSVQAVGEAA